ncbi:MAG: hypothetical protein GY909_01890 [Oligoflexia bacterium]|nr:hypothetical protein [Oligoflexia bacterium]
MRDSLKLLFIIIFASSCGVKKKTEASPFVKSALVMETSCTNDQQGQPFSSKSGFQKFYSKVNSLVTEFNQNQVMKLNGLQNYQFNEGMNYKSPLILSEKKLTERFDELKEKLENFFNQDPAQMSLMSPLLVNKDRAALVSILQEVGVLNESIARWEAQQCALSELSEKKNYDIRGLLSYREDQSREMALCNQVRNPGACKDEYRLHKRKGTISQFLDHYLVKNRDREKVFYQRDENVQLKCSFDQISKKHVIHLDIHLTKKAKEFFQGDLERMKTYAQSKWSNQDLQVAIDFVDSKELKTIFKKTKRSVSFVKTKKDKKVLYLSDKLSAFQRPIIFAHEVGHLLGFPDCYVEFYDSKNKEIIYYSLDNPEAGANKNIMCGLNLNAKVLDSYLEQLSSSLCR